MKKKEKRMKEVKRKLKDKDITKPSKGKVLKVFHGREGKAAELMEGAPKDKVYGLVYEVGSDESHKPWWSHPDADDMKIHKLQQISVLLEASGRLTREQQRVEDIEAEYNG